MDPLPLVPKDEGDNNVLPLINESFQYTFCNNVYPREVADYLKKYGDEDENKINKENAWAVIKVKEQKEQLKEHIRKVEENIMRNHAMALNEKNRILEPIEEEALKLKRAAMIQDVPEDAAHVFGLLQRNDLYPNRVEQYLDFTFNPNLHTCKQPCPPFRSEIKQIITAKRRFQQTAPSTTPPAVLVSEPEEIVFKNYTLNKTYKQKFKLRNISSKPQIFTYRDFPLDIPFYLDMLTEIPKIAPGMCQEFVVTFKPKIFWDYQECMEFKTKGGGSTVLLIRCTRDPPKLICCLYNPYLQIMEVKQPEPDSLFFSERRCKALNFTIDCGTCFLGNRILVILMMKNLGQKGKFFVTTENEWYFNELMESPTRAKELIHGPFSIFPTYLEIDHEDFGELLITFTPDTEGVSTEKIYMICDNYSYQEIELLGDAINFTNDLLNFNLLFKNNTFSYVYGLLTITLPPHRPENFSLVITNKGPVCLEYYWAITTDRQETKDKKQMQCDWLEMSKAIPYLPSFSTTETPVTLTPKTEEEGVYYCYLSLYLKNVPTLCMPERQFYIIIELEENSEFGPGNQMILTKNELKNKNILKNIKEADVHICELELLCVVQKPKVPPPKTESAPTSETKPSKICSSEFKTQVLTSRLKMSKRLLSFGILPKGVHVSKNFFIENLTERKLDWRLVEIRLLDDQSLEEIKSNNNLNLSRGTIRSKGEKRKIKYTIEAETCTKWISVLALFSSDNSCTCKDFKLEEICIVIYEVSDIKIIIHSGNLLPILCPKEFIYVGIPSIHTIYIQNFGSLVGCFYFLKPTGDDFGKIQVRFQPQAGMVPVGATVEVKVELLALENGIFEHLYIPCFTGDLEKLRSLKILCSVCSINVFFYLPMMEEQGLQRILWPPKEYGTFDTNYVREKPDGESSPKDEERQPLEGEDKGMSAVDDMSEKPELDGSLQCLIAYDSVAATYPTVKVRSVQVKRATKIKFYIENVTPVVGNFTIEPTNFSPDQECLNHVLVKAKTRRPEYFWDKACQNGYGIIIEPQQVSGSIEAYGTVEIELWIYANTWGKYLEEVIVEINDLTPFCFNLIVDVIGCPLEFPFARNTILKYPTIRFKNANYVDEENTRSFTITNISSISLHLSWYIFIPNNKSTLPFNIILQVKNDTVSLNVTEQYYGETACPGCIELNPLEFTLEKQSSTVISVTINSCEFRPSCPKKSNLQYNLLCFIDLNEEDKFKENYFRRLCGVDLNPARVNVLVTLETPKLELDLSSDETTIDLFANNILLRKIEDPEIYLLLKNVDFSPVHFSLEIEKPFYIAQVRTVPTGITDAQNLVLYRHECLQVLLKCHLSSDEAIQYSEFLYWKQYDKDNESDNVVSVIRKNLTIVQKGLQPQIIPFEIRLHYPRIQVKPSFIKFGQCLLYNTKRAIVSLYNLTGAPVYFELYKTSRRHDFEANPNHGEIAATTGVNKQFIDVTLYFTPTECRLYIENLRIMTNIPRYHIDVTMTGHGTNNEKFCAP